MSSSVVHSSLDSYAAPPLHQHGHEYMAEFTALGLRPAA